MARKKRFESPDEVEAAYYAAFEAADIEAMMEIWAEADHVVCVHPVGGHQLRGREAVLEGWIHVFARELDMRITLSDVTRTRIGNLAVHAGHENIVRRADPGVRGIVVFTNVYERSADGWKMILHHASPGPRPPAIEAPEGFMDDYDPGQLH
jgi:ketosteroid isomerase-like protein